MSLNIPTRYELKYVVPERLVEPIRQAIRPFCEPDPEAQNSPDGSYVIQSIYLDTWAHDLYRLTRERRPERVKLRIRAYGERPNPADGVFLEVKRRIKDVVRKTRARVDADWSTRRREPPRGKGNPAEQHFRTELDRLVLEPALLVKYSREAWTSTVDSYARVTFDRHIVSQQWPRWHFSQHYSNWLATDHRTAMKSVPRGVVLELKCELSVPRWMSNLTARFGLYRVGYSKYGEGGDRVWGNSTLRHFMSYGS